MNMTPKTMIFALLGLSALSLTNAGRADPLHPLALPEAGSPSIAQAQEDVVAQSGWLSIVIGDPSEPVAKQKGPHTKYLLTDAQGLTAEVDISPELLQSLGGNEKLRNKEVKVWGKKNKASGHITATHVEPTVAAAGGSGGSAPAPALSLSAPVSKPWATILCRFGDSPSVTPHDAPWFTTLMGNSYPGMDHFWRENSYDQMNLVGSQVYGWYNLPSPKSAYFTNGTNLSKLADDCAAVADADVYFPNFTGVNFMFNGTLNGAAWGGGISLTTDGLPPRGYAATWMPPWGYEAHHVMAQEMGHGFGLMHSSGAYASTYDSLWDPLSSGGDLCAVPHPQYGCIGVHTISFHKDKLGWIAPERKYIAQLGTAATIHIERLAQPVSTTGYLMAQIPLGTTGTQFYTVEARRSVGYDVPIPGEAIIIHNVDTSLGDRHAQVVDSDTTNTNPNDAGAMWTVGETFTDSARGISVTVQNMTSTGYDVTISNNPPAPDLLVSSVTALPTTAAGSTVNIPFQVKNQGGGNTVQGFSANVYLKWYIGGGGRILLGRADLPALTASGVVDASIPATLSAPIGAHRQAYQIEVVVDEANQILESKEDNNNSRSSGFPITTDADLTMTASTVPSVVNPGESINISATTVCNTGGAAGPFMTSGYLSKGAVLDATDPEIYWISFLSTGLAANTCVTASATATIPLGQAPGDYYLIAYADAYDVVPETNEGNNTWITAFRVNQAPTANAGAAQTVNEGAVVSLTGSGSDPDGGAIVSYAWTQTSGPTVTLSSTTVTNPTFTAPQVSADTVLTFQLTVTDNNGATSAPAATTVTVKNVAPSPDLIVTTQAATVVATVKKGVTTYKLSVGNQTKNQGNTSAGSSSVGYYLSTDAGYSSNDIFVCARSVTSLAAGVANPTTGVTTSSCSIPSGVVKGTPYYVIGVADYLKAVAESNEDNNAKSTATTIAAP